MFADLYRYLTAPFPWHLAPIGYVRESARLVRSTRRQRTVWAPHLERSRELILDAAARCNARDKALIIGSGGLADVPLAALCNRFREVTLADIVHPRCARRAAAKLNNARLVQADVTGVTRAVFDARAHRGDLPAVVRPDVFLHDDYDLVVSVNVLSQLPLLPLRYLRATRPDIPQQDLEGFARGLIERHLEWLTAFAARRCLITDFRRCEQHPEGVISHDLLFGIALPPGGETWTWQFARRRDRDDFPDIRHRVVGFASLPPDLGIGENA